MKVCVRRGSVAPLIINLVTDSRPSRFIPELKASFTHIKGPEPVQTLYSLHMTTLHYIQYISSYLTNILHRKTIMFLM